MAEKINIRSTKVGELVLFVIGSVTLMFNEKFELAGAASNDARYTTQSMSEFWIQCSMKELLEHASQMLISEVVSTLAKDFV